jgi:hypothetical protein
MRIPHYLQLAPSGVWHYRQRIPARLIPLVGRSIIKKSLLTRELGVARNFALRWRPMRRRRSSSTGETSLFLRQTPSGDSSMWNPDTCVTRLRR